MRNFAPSSSQSKTGIVHILRSTLGDAWSDSLLLIVTNVVWLVASLPLVTLPPATAGLFAVTNRLASGRVAGLAHFREGFRQYFWRSWQLAAADAVLPVVGLANLAYYAGYAGLVIDVMRGVWLAVLLLWLAVQPYLFPLMLEQADKRLRVTVRNAALLAVARPGLTLFLMLVTVIVVVASLAVFPVLILLAGSFLALLYNHAVRACLKPFRPEE